MTCQWCKHGYFGPGVTDQDGNIFCTPEHRAQYRLSNPKRCDCGCRRLNPTIVLGIHRFVSQSCLIGYETRT